MFYIHGEYNLMRVERVFFVSARFASNQIFWLFRNFFHPDRIVNSI